MSDTEVTPVAGIPTQAPAVTPVVGVPPPAAEPKKRTRRKKETKPRAPRESKSYIAIYHLANPETGSMRAAANAEGLMAKFEEPEDARKFIKDTLADGTYVVIRVLSEHTKTTKLMPTVTLS